MTRVLGLAGFMGCGKSTAARLLVERHGFVRLPFAAPLKAMLRAAGLGDEELDGASKELPHPLLCGRTPRYAMQTLGTEWGRTLIGPGLWVGLWERAVCAVLDQGAGGVVADDVRFAGEADAVQRLGGKVVRIIGRGEAGDHASERQEFHVDGLIGNYRDVAWLEMQVRQWAGMR